MTTGAIIQARTSSSRLPQKVLEELPYGSLITVLHQVIRRLKKSSKVDDFIVATTTDREDKKIVRVAEDENVKWFRGSREDVLSRYYLAAKNSKLDVVVRITGDCPCIDPAIVDFVIERHKRMRADYTSNTLERTFPHGLDVEVITFTALEKTYNEAKESFEREHVTPYVYTRPNLFRISSVKASRGLDAPDIRITLDTEEDYALLCLVFDYLYTENEFFTARDIINLFKRKPWLKLVNRKIVQKKIFGNLKEEIREAIKLCDLQDLRRAREFLEVQLHEGLHNN